MIPHFLVIGTHKSGTTWLDQNLRMHPEIWLPPEKELHYFNLPKNIPFTSFIFSQRREDRVWTINRLKRAYRRAKADPDNVGWYLRYYFLPRTDQWYGSLFMPDAGQMAGEVTPHYALLDDAHIARIHALSPDMKMVYLLRNPIDRMWSHAALQFSEKYNHEGLGAMDEKSVLNFLLAPKHLAHGRYYENLMRWENHYPNEQMFIGFFEEIANDPSRLLTSIFQFLGVADSSEHITERSKEKIYARDYPAIPNHIAVQLAEIFIDDLTKLHQRLESPHTAKWLAQCQSWLEIPIGTSEPS